MTATTNLPRLTLHEDNGGGLHLLVGYNDYPEWDYPEWYEHNCTIYYHLETISGEPDADGDGRALQTSDWNTIGQGTIERETLTEDSILDHPETRWVATFVDGHWQRTDEPIGNNGCWYLGISRDNE